jgi:predicted CopG family antitoxin
MRKNISISDEVYRRLKREKGDRSFGELIADRLDAGSRLADVSGQGILDRASAEAAARDIEELSQGTISRLVDRDP